MATVTRRGAVALRERGIEVRSTRDRVLLREFLERDRLRAAYAICDLDEREFGRTKWGIASAGGEVISVVLEYGGLTPQPLFVMGDPQGLVGILRDVVRPRLAYLAADASLLHHIDALYRIDPGPPMVRMWVNRQMFVSVPGSPDAPGAPGRVDRLLPLDIADLNRLYGLGFTAWLPAESIVNGVYFGVHVGGKLVAAAGTHVINREARLGVVGNVMTAPDFRGRGYAKLTTAAVTRELLRTCDEVVLNVRSDNPPAIAAYRALGYREHCFFEERLVHRRGTAWDSIVNQLRRLRHRDTEPRSTGTRSTESRSTGTPNTEQEETW